MLERLEKDHIRLLAQLVGRVDATNKLREAFIETIKVSARMAVDASDLLTSTELHSLKIFSSLTHLDSRCRTGGQSRKGQDHGGRPVGLQGQN